MPKTRIIPVFFLICFALFAGHDLFPHKHIEEHSHIADHGHSHDHHHHDHNHNKDNNEPEDDLINIFSFIPHTGNTFVTVHSANQIDFLKINKFFITNIPILSLHDFKPDIPPKIPDWDIPVYQNFISSCSSLRAPPSFLS